MDFVLFCCFGFGEIIRGSLGSGITGITQKNNKTHGVISTGKPREVAEALEVAPWAKEMGVNMGEARSRCFSGADLEMLFAWADSGGFRSFALFAGVFFGRHHTGNIT